eukprot:TRINITY_DN792_c0_g1_i5.p1 TRINITY_DN792_c0_g1~~TRINITY_DN792_c0_g1_i5.p1  ORF type:complete len:476 (+),score=92.63 TRINITY_DN792_c0_g1_i5:56-1483(+)
MSTSPVMQVSIPGQPGPREEQRPTNSHSPSPEVPVVKDVVDAFRSNGARRQTLSRSVSPVAAKNASAAVAVGVNHDGEEMAVSTKLVDRLRSRASVLFSGKRAKQRDELTRELKEKEQKRNARKSSSVQDDIEFAVYDFDKEKIEAHEKLKDIRDPMIVGKKPGWASVRWLNIDGFNAEVVQALGDSYNLHQLVMSDMIELNGRPKLDFYEEDGNIFIISKMISIEDELDTDIDEEIIYFYFNSTSGTLITFQEGRPGDVWEDVRKRLFRQTSKIRQSGADYLLFCLLDAILETCYPIVEMFGGRMEDLEFKLLKNATPQLNEQVYNLKRELLFLRRSIWPLRDAVLQIISDDMPSDVVREETKHFFRSINDRLLQINDMVETYAELAIGLGALYSNQQAQKMNNVMFVLTLVSAIFIPLTFVAGVYGMNFNIMPELGWKYGYLYVWVTFVSLAAMILMVFYKKGWIGSSDDSPV